MSDKTAKLLNVAVWGCLTVGSEESTISVIPVDHIVGIHYKKTAGVLIIVVTNGPEITLTETTDDQFSKICENVASLMKLKFVSKSLMSKISESSSEDE